MKKREEYPISFIYVLTTIQHQIQDLYASQKVPFFSSLPTLQTHFRPKRGHQRAGATLGSFSYIQKTATAVNIVEHQKTVDIEKHLKTDYTLFSSNQRVLSSLLAKKDLKHAQLYETKLEGIDRAHQLILENPISKK